MALTEEDLKALSALIRQEVSQQFATHLESFKQHVSESFDFLFRANETREQEYLAIKHQLDGHDKEFEQVRKELSQVRQEVKNHNQYLDDMDERVTVLEKKSA